MKRSVLVLFCLFLAAAASAQVRHRAAESVSASLPPLPRTPIAGAWSIEITSTGGFSGAGSGDLRIDSTGTLVVGQFVPKGQKCQFVLPQGDMNAVEAAVLSARADLWFASFFPAAEGATCCDRFFYKVRLERQERFAYDGHVGAVAYSTELLPDTVPNFPSDLKSLFQLVYANPDSVRARYAPACR